MELETWHMDLAKWNLKLGLGIEMVRTSEGSSWAKYMLIMLHTVPTVPVPRSPFPFPFPVPALRPASTSERSPGQQTDAHQHARDDAEAVHHA